MRWQWVLLKAEKSWREVTEVTYYKSNRGSSVKKIKILCLGTKPKNFGYMLGKEPRWMNWSMENYQIAIWFSCEKSNASVWVFPIETGSISDCTKA